VYSGDLKWKPEGSQDVVFAENPIAPVHKDILITKLRPGQSIELEARCEKGQGKTHAKWSPVSTASYRLLPEITLKQPGMNIRVVCWCWLFLVLNEEAEELVKLCPMKVFDIEDISSSKYSNKLWNTSGTKSDAKHK
jgi:DNA-directed RNA polymerase I and III subunit RPAC1